VALAALLTLCAVTVGCRSPLGRADLAGPESGTVSQAPADGAAEASTLPTLGPRPLSPPEAAPLAKRSASQDAPLPPPVLADPHVVPANHQEPDLPPPTPTPVPAGSASEKKKSEAPEAPTAAADQPPPVCAPPAGVAKETPPRPFANRCKAYSLSKLCKDVPVHAAPKELRLVNTPPYIIQTPDILLIESPRSLPDQPIAGEHLVRADGTVSLGLYGSVHVAGLTIEEARQAVEKHLTPFLREPKVSVDVYAYNSKFYYVITDGAGYGEQVIRLTFTGNETVLDAISQIGGLPNVASKKRIWIARPDAHDEQSGFILPVNWTAIAQCGQRATNYQIFPNDRLYIHSDRLQALDGIVAKVLSPIERIVGATLLTGFTIYRYENLGRQGFNTAGATVVTP
jgi:protein involved in polysaccharide export with SLBB domain